MTPFPTFSCCVIRFQWLTQLVTRGGRNEKIKEEDLSGERLFMEWQDTQSIILAYLSYCLSIHIIYHLSIWDEKMWVINLNGVIPKTYDFTFHEHSRCGCVYLQKLNNVNVMWMHWVQLQMAVHLIWIQAREIYHVTNSNMKIWDAQNWKL